MSEFIVIEQATYGEVNKGHDLIQTTFSDTKIAKAIKGFTDLFPKAPLNMRILSYLSGFDYDDYYIFSRTFMDDNASRSSMVFTHTLWIKKTDIAAINRLETVLELLPIAIDKEKALTAIKIPTTNRVLRKETKDYQQKLIAGLMQQQSIVWIDDQLFEPTLCALWNNVPFFIRQNLRFRLSFQPEDLDFLNPNIVYTPSTSENKWERHFKVKITDIYESQSLLEFYISQDERATALFDLETQLNHQPQSIEELRLLEQIANRLEQNDNSFVATLSLVRLLSRYVPTQQSEIKAQQIHKLNQQIRFCTPKDFSKLRNVDIQPFGNVKSEFISTCQQWLNKTIIDLETSLFTQFCTTKQTWFQSILIQSVQDKINHWKSNYALLFWNWLSNDLLLSNIEIPNNTAVATDLVQYQVDKIEQKVAQKLQKVATQYQWFQLHAIVIPTLYTPKVAIEKQLQLDDTSATESLQLLANKLPHQEFIKYTLSNPNERLTAVSGQLCAKNTNLFHDFDVQNNTWLAIWTASFSHTSDIWKGILQPQKVVFALLDKLLDKSLSKPYQITLFEKIATSKFNNLYAYPNRQKIWKVLPITTKDSFLKATVWAWLKAFEEDDEILMENELKGVVQGMIREIIKSDYSVKSIIKLFEINRNLSESDLKLLIERRHKDIDDVLLAKRLGKLISGRKWRNAFDEVRYKKYWNELLKFTIDECRDLRRYKLLSWLDTPHYSEQETSKAIRQGIYKCLENGDLDKALDAIKEWNEIENLRKGNEINVFYSRKNRMEDDRRKGTITREEYSKEYSKLVWDLGKTVEKWKI